jgi:Glycosyl transferase family 8
MAGRNAIAVMCDAKLFPAAVFLCDRLSSLNTRTDTDVLLFTESEADIDIALEFGVRFLVGKFDPALAEKLPHPPSRNLSPAAYYRLFLPELVGDVYDRILYLDVDVYPENETLFSLFDLGMGQYAIAAVRSLMHHIGTRETHSVLRQGGTKYLNSGVLLIDRSAFVERSMSERLFEAASHPPARRSYYDQSILNYVLDGDWLELSQNVNMMPHVWNSPARRVFEPVIRHFPGPVKPWHGSRFRLDHPVRRELERFVLATPWKGFLADQFGLADALKRLDRPQRVFDEGPGWQLTPPVVEHLRNGVFADVEQGLTVLHTEFLTTPGLATAGRARPR